MSIAAYDGFELVRPVFTASSGLNCCGEGDEHQSMESCAILICFGEVVGWLH